MRDRGDKQRRAPYIGREEKKRRFELSWFAWSPHYKPSCRKVEVEAVYRLCAPVPEPCASVFGDGQKIIHELYTNFNQPNKHQDGCDWVARLLLRLWKFTRQCKW